MSLIKAHGFLTAIVSSPGIILLREWHAVLFDGRPAFKSKEHATTILELINRLHNFIEAKLKNNDPSSFSSFLILSLSFFIFYNYNLFIKNLTLTLS